MQSLQLSGTGIVCAVGWDSVNACASIRAGLSRRNETPDFSVEDEDSIFPAPLMSASLAGLTDGYGPLGTWARLLQLAVRDLLRGIEGQGALAEEATAAIVIAPSFSDGARFDVEDGSIAAASAKPAVAGFFGSTIPLAISPANVHFLAEGQAGLASGIALAASLLSGRSIKHALLLGIDCLVDPLSLKWASSRGRLKTPDMPVGFVPGEAGACVLLETAATADARRAKVLGTIVQVASAIDDSVAEKREAPGRALSRAIRGALGSTAFAGHVVVDANGEHWRALELGSALSECSDVLSGPLDVLYPCVSTGEVGAAYGPIALAVAAHTFTRRYNKSGHSLVLCSSDDGRKGAVLFRGS
jgi:3-oxoacyl-[acyl-carrier-protein] synthase-1